MGKIGEKSSLIKEKEICMERVKRNENISVADAKRILDINNRIVELDNIKFLMEITPFTMDMSKIKAHLNIVFLYLDENYEHYKEGMEFFKKFTPLNCNSYEKEMKNFLVRYLLTNKKN